jgi:hypothetical protein
MTIDIFQTILGGFIASVVWFIVGGALYMNPFVAKIYKDIQRYTKIYKDVYGSPGLKKWSSVPKYIGLQYAGILAQCLLWAFVFALVKSALSEEVLICGFNQPIQINPLDFILNPEVKEKAMPDTCVVCGDSRPFVLQVHHADPEKKIEVMLCANCHDTVRRGTFGDLREAHNGDDE